MNRTYTPELAPDVLNRLTDHAGRFPSHFHHPKQAAYCGVYLQGLLLDGERKSIEPMARRVHFPQGFQVADPDQALQQFAGQRPWDDAPVMRTYRSVMAEAFGSPAGLFVVDDTGLPKQGKHAVGVGHQYRGALGEKANCQVATSPHQVGPRGYFPLAMRLDLPKAWTQDAPRLRKAGVPEAARAMRIDQVRGEGIAGRVVLAEAGHGRSEGFRDGLDQRGLRSIVGVTDEMVVFQSEPKWDDPASRRVGRDGRPPSRSQLAQESPRPMTLATKLPRCKVSSRQGTKQRLTARFTWVRVWLAGGWEGGECRGKSRSDF